MSSPHEESENFNPSASRVMGRPSFYERIAGVDLGALKPPHPHLESAAFLVGRWKQTSERFATPTTPGRVRMHDGFSEWKRVQQGHAFLFHNPGFPDTGVTYLFYDPYIERWAQVSIHTPAEWGVGTTSGWINNELVFEGEMRIIGDLSMWRNKLVKIDEDHWKYANDELQSDGTWRAIDEHRFERAAS